MKNSKPKTTHMAKHFEMWLILTVVKSWTFKTSNELSTQSKLG